MHLSFFCDIYFFLLHYAVVVAFANRYFVLYSTAMGHYMSYYSDYSDSPLFSNERKERNLIDLGKVTFIRPVSNQQDAPMHSFDIVTIEREWTLCAQNEDDMQLWLQLLTTAVDEDVAIAPDDELEFEVKTLKDNTNRLIKYDYSTVITVSANGVGVGTRSTKCDYYERFFWCYTDFYKWSVGNSFGKLSLAVSVFNNTDFSQSSKLDFEFRTRQAVQLASAIEFYIEKFMSVMYLKNEGVDYDGGEGEVEYGNGQGYDEDDVGEEYAGESEDDEGGEDNVAKTVDLLSLNEEAADEPPLPPSQPPLVTAVPTTASNNGENLPIVEAALVTDPAAGQAPPQPPASAPVFDPFGGPDQVSAGGGIGPMENGATGGGSGDGGVGVNGDLTGLSLSIDDDNNINNNNNNSNNKAPTSLLDAFATPAVKVMPSNFMHNMENNNILQFLCGRKEGIVYAEPGLLNVIVKVEWRGSQGRLSYCVVNAGSSDIKNLRCKIDNSTIEQSLRTMIGEFDDNGTLRKGQKRSVQIMIECMQPFDKYPVVDMEFEIQNQHASIESYKYPIILPVTLCDFMSPTPMSGTDFMSRWQKLSMANLQSQCVINSKKSTGELMVESVFSNCGMHVIKELSDKSGGLCAAGTIRTGTNNASSGGKVAVGVLCRVEINNVAQAYRVTVRTAHTGVSDIVMRDIKCRLTM